MPLPRSISVRASHVSHSQATDKPSSAPSLEQLTKSHKATSIADRIGISLSALCLVHCIVLPLALPLLAISADVAEPSAGHSIVHHVLALLILPTTLWSAWHGYKHHGRTSIPTLLMLGATLITVAALFGEQFPTTFFSFTLPEELWETALTVAGSALLVSGHWLNWRHEKHSQHSH